MRMQEQEIDYCDQAAELSGLMVWDGGDQPRPGALLVHGGAGLDEHARCQARRLARLGIAVFACDMYGKSVTGDRERVLSTIQELTADRTNMARRAHAGVDVLASHPVVTGQLAAIGYCFGGRAVLDLARTGADLAGAISVHGSLSSAKPAGAGEITAKLLVCHGALDPHVPAEQVLGFIEEMNGAHADYQLIVYGGAMHGFTHEPGATSPGVAHHAPSDQRSFAAIATFLSEVFRRAL